MRCFYVAPDGRRLYRSSAYTPCVLAALIRMGLLRLAHLRRALHHALCMSPTRHHAGSRLALRHIIADAASCRQQIRASGASLLVTPFARRVQRRAHGVRSAPSLCASEMRYFPRGGVTLLQGASAMRFGADAL